MQLVSQPYLCVHSKVETMQLVPQVYICVQFDIKSMPAVAQLLAKVSTVNADPRIQRTVALAGIQAARGSLQYMARLPAADIEAGCQVITNHLVVSLSALLQR